MNASYGIDNNSISEEIQKLPQKIRKHIQKIHTERWNDIEVQQVQHRRDEALANDFKYRAPQLRQLSL